MRMTVYTGIQDGHSLPIGHMLHKKMRLQVTLVWESFSTDIALKRPFACVFSHMKIQCRLRNQALVTVPTQVLGMGTVCVASTLRRVHDFRSKMHSVPLWNKRKETPMNRHFCFKNFDFLNNRILFPSLLLQNQNSCKTREWTTCSHIGRNRILPLVFFVFFYVASKVFKVQT